MNTTLKSALLLLTGMAAGGAGLYLSQPYWNPGATAPMATEAADQKQPLYWVAPMDPNYRRDQPGKSPMGMDLIPVYEEDGGGGPDAGPGTIRISPEVINNLGVRTARAEARSLNFEVRTVGYVQYNQDKIVHIHPRVEGWVERLHVQAAGEAVERGQPLYSLYSPALVNAQEELLFALARKDARLTAAAEARLRSLNLDPRTIAEIKRRRKPSQTVTFYAPASGVVDDFALREGFFVKPGMTLMSVGALDEVWVEAEVFERQASLVREGLPVTMALDYLPGREWQGRVDYVYPTLDPETRTLRVRMRFDNPDRALKPNMFAQVSIHHQEAEPVLSIPREALIRGGRDRVVLALGEGRYKSVEVTAGRSDGARVEILDGLAAGETVVTSAQFLLDSESSKSSDFKRMHRESDPMAGMAHDGMQQPAAQSSAKPTRVWVDATVTQVMADEMKVKVQHGAIPDWQWPEMEMEFAVSELVDFEALKPGAQGQIEVQKLEQGGYRISDIYLSEADSDPAGAPASESMPAMDHSQMDHSQMSQASMQPSADTSAANPERVWVDATVIQAMPDQMKVKVQHGAIPDWQWPEMEMEFAVSELVDFEALKPGAQGQIEVQKLAQGGYRISDIYFSEPDSDPAGGDMPAMDHGSGH